MTSGPGIWVEPKGNWGAGAVQLVEIPTDDEIHDNIVAYWRPEGDVRAGDSAQLRLSPLLAEHRAHLSQEHRQAWWRRGMGRGGMPGQNPWPRDKRKFVVDFTGGTADRIAAALST